jgi:energy-coupling factor transporter transmembrane protein EcfT
MKFSRKSLHRSIPLMLLLLLLLLFFFFFFFFLNNNNNLQKKKKKQKMGKENKAAECDSPRYGRAELCKESAVKKTYMEPSGTE